MAEVSIADVDQAEAALADAKEAHYAPGERSAEEQQAYDATKEHVVAVRRAWREQEESAGRRGPGVTVGGDAEEG